MSRVLLTGASGYVGARILKVLVSHGHSVTAVVRSATSEAAALQSGAHHVIVTPYQALSSGTLRKFDIVVHAALDASDSAKADAALIDAVRQVPATRKPFFIYVSGLFVVGTVDAVEITEVTVAQPPALLQWRFDVEQQVTALGGAVVRPGMVWGNRGSSALEWVETIRKHGAKHVNGPGGVFPFVHVNDLADLVEVVIRKRRPGVLHAVDGRESVAYDALVRAFNARCFASAPVVNVPLEDARKVMGGWADLMNLRFPFCDNATARALGWTPAHGSPLDDSELERWVAQNVRSDSTVPIKHIVMVPRWSGTNASDWYPTFREHLHKHHGNVRVIKVELQPNKDAPEIDACVNAIEEAVRRANLDVRATLFIGHSVGAQAIMRWLVDREVVPVGGLLLVGAWFSLTKATPAQVPWCAPLDGRDVRQLSHKTAVVISKNDPYTADWASTQALFRDEVGAHVVFEDDALHFNRSAEPTVLRVAETFFL